MDNKNSEHYIHKEFPKTKAKDDFWGQVCRTVNGKNVSEDDIALIIKSIKSHLLPESRDTLLDIGCGNGALGQYLFDDLDSYHGVDFSEYLISIANEYFARPPKQTFCMDDAINYSQTCKDAHRFTKALCYGVFSYFSPEQAKDLLKSLFQRFENLQTVYIGNIADREKAASFYYSDIDYKDLLSDHTTSIGYWWDQADLIFLANDCGWHCKVTTMPEGFYAAHYRFDLVLSRDPV